uniref:Putative secreted protein n=1 Tax=Anopheles darlingi TaxID=43151 RepID=A0A2M4D5I0_ANODA
MQLHLVFLLFHVQFLLFHDLCKQCIIVCLEWWTLVYVRFTVGAVLEIGTINRTYLTIRPWVRYLTKPS